MSKPAEAARESAIEIRFGQIHMLQVLVRTTDTGALLDELTGRVASAPKFFEHAAVCVDISALNEPDAPGVRAALEAVRRAGMVPVGLSHRTAQIDALAREVEMPVLTLSRSQSKPAPVVSAAEPPEPAGGPSLIHHQPVRSGQRIYARHRDLVVTATVGAGAEVIADGCVHIYGPLRGRAIAGARGDTTARVFCQEFHAELVSIAGVFRVFETLPAELAGKPVQAWLDGENLHLARIGD